MYERGKQNGRDLIKRLSLLNPKNPGERRGAYRKRLLRSHFAQLQEAEKSKNSVLPENAKVPATIAGKLLDNCIIKPLKSLVKNIERVIEFIKFKEDLRDDGVEYFMLSKNNFKKTGQLYIKTTGHNGITVLMSVTVVKTLIAVLPLKGSKADKTVQSHTLITSCGTSTYVTIAPLTITNLHAAATAYGNSNPGNEETLWLALNNGLKAMMAVFQTYCNANPLNASDCLTLAGFKIKKITPRGKQPWSAKNNVVAGVIDLTAAGGGTSRCFHEWWISYNGSTFVRLEGTMQASCQVSGLASGTTIYFMHQLITADGPQGMDLVIKIPVD